MPASHRFAVVGGGYRPVSLPAAHWWIKTSRRRFWGILLEKELNRIISPRLHLVIKGEYP